MHARATGHRHQHRPASRVSTCKVSRIHATPPPQGLQPPSLPPPTTPPPHTRSPRHPAGGAHLGRRRARSHGPHAALPAAAPRQCCGNGEKGTASPDHHCQCRFPTSTGHASAENAPGTARGQEPGLPQLLPELGPGAYAHGGVVPRVLWPHYMRHLSEPPGIRTAGRWGQCLVEVRVALTRNPGPLKLACLTKEQSE